jgi:NAD-dependent dihydropyrimidine dehydrogenase PreA subunit
MKINKMKIKMSVTLLPLIDTALCDGCGRCVTHCTAGALAMADGKAILAHPQLCNYDAACEDACPIDAIALPYQVVFAPPQSPPDAD